MQAHEPSAEDGEEQNGCKDPFKDHIKSLEVIENINWSYCISKVLQFCSHWSRHREALQEPHCSRCYRPLCNLQPGFIHSLFKPPGCCVSCCDVAESLLTTVNLRLFKGQQSVLQAISSHQLSLLGHTSAGTYLCRLTCLHLSMFDLIWVRMPVCVPQCHVCMAKNSLSLSDPPAGAISTLETTVLPTRNQ